MSLACMKFLRSEAPKTHVHHCSARHKNDVFWTSSCAECLFKGTDVIVRDEFHNRHCFSQMLAIYDLVVSKEDWHHTRRIACISSESSATTAAVCLASMVSSSAAATCGSTFLS